MTTMKLNVNQQLDELGGEFLDERDFEIELDFDRSDDYVVCVIDGKPDCYIKRSDLRLILAVLNAT